MSDELLITPIVDLGLTLEEAKVGLREVTAADSGFPVDRENGPIHPLAKMQIDALYMVLVNKGIFTVAEYEEVLRVVYNSELAQREAQKGREFR
jgi:hypothetical protein